MKSASFCDWPFGYLCRKPRFGGFCCLRSETVTSDLPHKGSEFLLHSAISLPDCTMSHYKRHTLIPTAVLTSYVTQLYRDGRKCVSIECQVSQCVLVVFCVLSSEVASGRTVWSTDVDKQTTNLEMLQLLKLTKYTGCV